MGELGGGSEFHQRHDDESQVVLSVGSQRRFGGVEGGDGGGGSKLLHGGSEMSHLLREQQAFQLVQVCQLCGRRRELHLESTVAESVRRQHVWGGDLPQQRGGVEGH